MSDNPPRDVPRASTGVSGLDQILGDGLTPSRMYLIEGAPGTGKTTFALNFLMAGARQGESGLYITLSETAEELAAVVESHGWSTEGIELGETIRAVTERISRSNPARVVFDSLSEMRLLAQDPMRYRRQILALKHFFANRQCTVLLLDDMTSAANDLQLHSIAHGVVSLGQRSEPFGGDRRHLRVVKMRGMKFQGGYHDFLLDTGRVEVFPRLVAGEHHSEFAHTPVGTGCAGLDDMLGGGLVPGTNTLLLGPSGVGKSTTAAPCILSAIERGERASYYLLAMPGQSFLLLHMHELLSFLNQQGVTTVLVMGQHGLIGEVLAEIDLSYLSDSILLCRFFEAGGEVRTAASAVKCRTTENQRGIREFRVGSGQGLQVGDSLSGFEGVLGGLPTYRGDTPMLGADGR